MGGKLFIGGTSLQLKKEGQCAKAISVSNYFSDLFGPNQPLNLGGLISCLGCWSLLALRGGTFDSGSTRAPGLPVDVPRTSFLATHHAVSNRPCSSNTK